MQLAFCLYKYFPYGGLQRDFLRIARACQARGHTIRVYTLEWEAPPPDNLEIIRVPVRAWSNHRRYARFTTWVHSHLLQHPVDRIVGFNKMPGLDFYYAADPCFEEKARTLRKPLYRYSARYRHFSAYERAVFSPESETEILMISTTQQPFFIRYYGTPAKRFHLLPPGIAQDRRAPANAADIRQHFRQQLGLDDSQFLLVQIGSDFPRKGLDRSIAALAALPPALRARTHLIALGADNPRPFLEQARAAGIHTQVQLPGGRDDIPDFLLSADLLLHPARHENTGTVLLEALVAGLPVLASAACGYAHYITDADAGCITPEPFSQADMNQMLETTLTDNALRQRWHSNALAFAEKADLYSLPEKAADIILKP